MWSWRGWAPFNSTVNDHNTPRVGQLCDILPGAVASVQQLSERCAYAKLQLKLKSKSILYVQDQTNEPVQVLNKMGQSVHLLDPCTSFSELQTNVGCKIALKYLYINNYKAHYIIIANNLARDAISLLACNYAPTSTARLRSPASNLSFSL
jgi:hypothetical protein